MKELTAKQGVQNTEREEKKRYLKSKLHTGEKILMEVEFSLFPGLFIYLAAAAGLLILQRFTHQMILSALCSLACMWCAMDAARVVLYVQNSVLFITNQRVIGQCGDGGCDVDLRKVVRMDGKTTLTLQGGPENSVRIQHMKNPLEVARLIHEQMEIRKNETK